MSERSLDNLKKGVPIQEQPNANHGRYPTLVNAIEELPPDAQKKVYAALWKAISMRSVKEASKYLSKEVDNLPEECGVVMQIALKGLLGKNGLNALMNILDRLFGKPKTNAEVTLDGKVQGITVKVDNSETAEQLQNILNK